MPDYPRPCPKCRTVNEREGFAVDRHAASGRKSCCKACDRQRRKAYYELHKDEWNAEREAEREAARQVELAALAVEHKKRVAAAKKEHEAGVRRQKKLLRELGVPELSPEEVTERARAAPGRRQRDTLAEQHP